MFEQETNNLQPSVEQWLLRRLSPRALRVLETYKNASAPLASFVPTLKPAAETFIRLYDDCKTEKSVNDGFVKGRQDITELRELVLAWLARMSRDFDYFDRSDYNERLDVADDIIGTAKRLLDLLQDRQQNGQQNGQDNPPYLDLAIENLSAAVDKAVSGWAENQGALGDYQNLLAQTRQAAAVLQKELVSFRQALRRVIGSSHRDYRTLRVETARKNRVDDNIEDEAGIETEIETNAEPSADAATTEPAVRQPLVAMTEVNEAA